MITEDKLDEIGARFEHFPKEPRRELAQETEGSEKSTLSAFKFPK
jgi:hypothetical protein